MFNLSKSVIIVSLAAGLVTGFAVWHFIYRCEDPTCVITYVNLVICLLVLLAFALVTGEEFFRTSRPGETQKAEIARLNAIIV